MFLLVSAAILVVAHGKKGDADCHVFGSTDYGSCGMQVGSALGVDCMYKGGSAPSKACVTAALNTPADCGKCFKVTLHEPGAPKNTPGCGPNGCPKYDRSILVYVIDLTGKADYEIAQNGWSGVNGLCPGVCAHTSYCSEKASDCQYGWLPDAGEMKSGCYSNSKHITHEEVPCPGGTGGKSGGKPSGSKGSGGSGGTTPPKPKGSGSGGRPSGGGGSGGGGGGFSCPSAGFFADPSDAHKYYQCASAGGQKWHQSCGSLYWNQKIKNCMPTKS